MKKFYKKITALVCVLLLIFSTSGCSLILDVDDTDNPPSSSYSEITLDVNLTEQLIFCDTGTEDASSIDGVTFRNNAKTEDYQSFEQVASTVNRSVVEIIMMDNNDNHLSYGSGVIVDIDAGLSLGEHYILTCHHVVSNAGKITVCVPDANLRNYGDLDYNENYMFTGYIGGDKQDKSALAVSLVGGDRDADIAVLKLKVTNPFLSIQEATFPQSGSTLAYAQEVFSIGNPTGQLPMTFLSGNISYLDRLVVLDSIGYMELIQHDCLITHGNSGGGLFNMKGQLIGITNAGSDVYKGMNYAIPYYGVDGFMAIAEQLIENSTPTNYGYVEGRWSLGVTITENGSSVKGSSVSVAMVESNSNADGLFKKGDYITKVEFNVAGENYSYNVTSANEFKNAIFIAREGLVVGDTIKVTVARQVLENVA